MNLARSKDEWLAARKQLLAREKELTHQRDALSAERRALPWLDLVPKGRDEDDLDFSMAWLRRRDEYER